MSAENKKKTTRFRVAWKSKMTGATGHGEFSSNEALIRHWVELKNKKNPEVVHHLEEE